ncbi:MAG: hypothetical protein KGL98_05765 [Gammaproteobacteria bacterium]|nr:hypothetical protein [Gammaproteobacteria bacterium]MBU6509400.1 hypothetical protein [Gammaproteobacteria bacterium]MDE1983792.1 hypothetical protein [Gammaproteobacteria bacterium]MDE2107769.1 hypothetical protein [Gammaproteobacteria bacterium]MDE2460737.1 hypothetical protein [Gammaproteobacteria bacterium]
MHRHYAFLTLLTAFVVIIAIGNAYIDLKVSGLPFEIDIVTTHTAVIKPIEGIPLPQGIQTGDRLDLTTQPLATRAIIGINILSSYLQASLPLGHTYDFVIERNNQEITVPITSVKLGVTSQLRTFQWMNLIQLVITAIFALLVLWRGRNRAAAGMTLFTIGFVAGGIIFPLDGWAGLAIVSAANIGNLLARVGFYVMADAVAQPILSRGMRRLYFGLFILILSAGAALFSLGGPVLYVLTDWAGGLLPRSGLVWSASFLVPLLLLFASYQHATQAQRLRLRWMLWSGVIYLVGIVTSNTPILSLQFSVAMTYGCQLTGTVGFLYAVLRHRVVDVSVFLDRTLVYGTITALVVGVLAAVNSLVQHAALGTNASLLLQVAVPLSLGIVLTRLRAYLDRIVERVFFRKKYLADKALRRFAALCGRFEDSGELLATASVEIRRHLGARGVAFYERRTGEYTCVHQEGEVHYPPQAKIDDTAFVAARADQTDIDLAELHSGLGNDGYVFPMSAHGEMQYVLVCANRPGEHYSSDERLLLAHVTHEMGMALYALRMQARARVVEALATASPTSLPEIQTAARALLSTAPAG